MTGRFQPPCTVTSARGSWALNPRSSSVDRSCCAAPNGPGRRRRPRAVPATTLERVPPRSTPTLTVVPAAGSAAACSCSTSRAISSTALAPDSGSRPACDSTPRTCTSKMPTPLRPVFTAPSALASNTSTAAASAQASLDQRARERAADLLVAVEQQAQRRVRHAGGAQRAHRPDRLHQPGLHVEDAGPGDAVPVDPDRPVVEGAGAPHRVVVREQGQRVRTGTGVLEHHDVAVLGGLVPGPARGLTEPVGQPLLDVREPLPQQREVVARGLLLRVAHQVVHEFAAPRIEPAVQRGDVDAVHRGRRAARRSPQRSGQRGDALLVHRRAGLELADVRDEPLQTRRGDAVPGGVASTGR